MPPYDVAVVGAGVTGTALLHMLARYTDVGRVVLIEGYQAPAQVNSKSTANSQTLHFGDIETNYSVEKARRVAEAAGKVAAYLERSGAKGLSSPCGKMVLGVGEDEVQLLRRRFTALKDVYPGLAFLERDALGEAEPAIVLGRSADVPLAALKAAPGCAVDFGRLSESFLADAKAAGLKLDCFFGVRVQDIKKHGDVYRLDPPGIEAKTVVCAAGGISLLFAHRLGVGLEYGILPVAGDYFLSPKVLNGKVYTVQDDRLPFAAVHGDPDLLDASITRFGPTARVLPLLERGSLGSVWSFLRSTRADPRLAWAALSLLGDDAVRRFAFENAVYTLPVLGRRAFAKTARKIVPELSAGDLRPAPWAGGVRPQLVDKRAGTLPLGEAKLTGDNILFDVTPSPGASTCLKGAEDDARTLCRWLGRKFDG